MYRGEQTSGNPFVKDTRYNLIKTADRELSQRKSRIIPEEMFPSILFYWPEFFDSDFNSILTKADKIHSCINDALKERNYTVIKFLGEYFSYYHSKFHTSNGILFMEDKMAIQPQLRSPIMVQLHKGHAA